MYVGHLDKLKTLSRVDNGFSKFTKKEFCISSGSGLGPCRNFYWC